MATMRRCGLAVVFAGAMVVGASAQDPDPEQVDPLKLQLNPKANAIANAKICCANQRMIAGAMAMYELDKKVKPVRLDPELLRQLMHQGYLQAIPQCVGQGPGSEKNYYVPLNPAVSVACRVHGVGTCPRAATPGPSRKKRERPDLTEILPTEDDAAIHARFDHARKVLDEEFARIKRAILATRDGSEHQKKIEQLWIRDLREVKASLTKAAAAGQANDPVRGLVEVGRGFEWASELAERVGRFKQDKDRLDAEIAAQRKQMDDHASAAASRVSTAALDERARRSLVGEMKELQESTTPPDADRKAALLAGQTNAADEVAFGKRLRAAMGWLGALESAGRPAPDLRRKVDRLHSDYQTNPLKAARALDALIRKLGELDPAR